MCGEIPHLFWGSSLRKDEKDIGMDVYMLGIFTHVSLLYLLKIMRLRYQLLFTTSFLHKKSLWLKKI